MNDLKYNKVYSLEKKPYSYTIEATISSQPKSVDICETDDDDYAMYHQYYMGGLPSKPTPKKEKTKDPTIVDNGSFLIFVNPRTEITIMVKKFVLASYEVNITKLDSNTNSKESFDCFINQKILESIINH